MLMGQPCLFFNGLRRGRVGHKVVRIGRIIVEELMRVL